MQLDHCEIITVVALIFPLDWEGRHGLLQGDLSIVFLFVGVLINTYFFLV